MAILTYSDIAKILKYEPETGKLFWLPRTAEMFEGTKFPQGPEAKAKNWNARYAGVEAFKTVHARGYIAGALLGKAYLAHRVVWLFETGSWPVDQLDHINGDRTDNRFENLREVTNTENSKNKAITKRNKSGFQGVFWNPKIKRWNANIGLNSRTKNLGHFLTKEEAIAARKNAEIELGFHPNHNRSC